MSPAGTETYNKDNYDPYNYLAQDGGDKDGFIYDKGMADYFVKTCAEKKHPYTMIHELPICLRNIVMGLVIDGLDPYFKKGKHPEELVKVFKVYHRMMLENTG